MINNKTITITKQNVFDKGWSLFEPFGNNNFQNRSFLRIDHTDIISAITFANTVNIILSEICLSSRIVAELEWVNKYIKLNIIVKSEEILKAYSKLHFDNVEVDESISFNFLCLSL